MVEQLDVITGLSATERKKVLSWVVSLPEVKIIEIFQAGVKKAYEIKDANPQLPGRVCKYGAFVYAARQSGWDTVHGKGYRVAGKKQYEDFDHIRRAKSAELIRRGRNPIKRKKVLAYWGEIKQMKEEGLGFRVISSYLKKNRKVEVSASYLATLWKSTEVIYEI